MDLDQALHPAERAALDRIAAAAGVGEAGQPHPPFQVHRERRTSVVVEAEVLRGDDQIGDLHQFGIRVVPYARWWVPREADAVRSQAIDIWGEELETLGAPVEAFPLDSGTVWGLNVVLDAWLVGPVPHARLRGADR